jgi:Protein of unknown function (DUF2809)
MQHTSRPIPTGSPLPPTLRKRVHYVALSLAVVAAGLLWRSGLIPLPHALSNLGGDALWAMMVFFGFGFLLPQASPRRVAALALAFAWSIEFSQLYHAAWIDAIRDTIPGKLILGNTFNWPDLPAYAAGIALGLLIDWRLSLASSPPTRRKAGG